MSRFGEIDNLNKVVKEAALSATTKKETETKQKILLYGISTSLKKAVEQSDESFSAFARRAIRKLAKEEGLI